MKRIQATAVVTAMALICSALPCQAQGPDLLEGPPAPKAFDSRPIFDTPRGDGRRTMGAFPKNLGRNFVGVFSGQNLLPMSSKVSAARDGAHASPIPNVGCAQATTLRPSAGALAVGMKTMAPLTLGVPSLLFVR